MKREILNTSNIYKAICLASSMGKKLGLSVGKLKKEYKMKPRDIKLLLSFLENFIIDDNFYIQFEVYRLSNEIIANDKFNNCTYEELIDYIEDVDLTQDDLTNDVFIKIQDKIFILGEKIHEDNIDIRNASLIQSIRDIGETWNKISNFQINEDYILIKESTDLLPKDKKSIKRNWINAIVKGHQVNLEYKFSSGRKKDKKVLPIGMYYNKFLTDYIYIYLENLYEKKEYKDIYLSDISSIKVYDDDNSYSFDFNIDEYITSTQKEKIVLYVFHEGNVGKKLKSLLADNQLDVKYGKDYDIFTFMVEDSWQYMKVIKSYGRSVIVVEPEIIKENIIDNINETLNIYNNEINIHKQNQEN